MTDRYPVDIFYVEHLDQVWIVNWRDEEDHGVKTIQVIREASQKKKHHTVHPEPIDGHFDLVYSLFIPPMQVRFPLFLFFPNPFNIPCPRSTIYNISYILFTSGNGRSTGIVTSTATYRIPISAAFTN